MRDARGPGPFQRHLREAIEVNRARAPAYAALSGGASLPISRALVRSERLLLPVAWWLDRRAEPYHRAGVPLLEDLFVGMDAIPDLPCAPSAPGTPPPAAPPLGAIRRRIARAFGGGGLAGARPVLEEEVARLAAAPGFDCMLRHLLESALRLCSRAPLHVRDAGERALRSPEGIVRTLFRLHLRGLGPAARLDARARPLQARGIPILCRDVPPIPPDGGLRTPARRDR